MLKGQRLEEIVQYVNDQKYVSFAELMRVFSISKATVRRDLEQLEKEKRLALIRGGAVSKSKGTSYEPPFMEKRKYNAEEKKRIARAAAELVAPGDTIMLDSGTTCLEIPPFLQEKRDLTVATNDLMIARALVSYPEVNTVMIGGVMRKQYYTVNGYFTEMLIKEFHFDKLFLSTDAVDEEHGCMITNMEEVSVKRSMIEAADEVILLCDHTKFGAMAFIHVCDLNKISRIITGAELDPVQHEQFQNQGMEIQMV